MTTVTAQFSSAAWIPTRGMVTAWSAQLRPSGDIIVTTEQGTVPIVDGAFTMKLVPGPVHLKIKGNGPAKGLTITVPEPPETDPDDTEEPEEYVVDLVDLIDDVYDNDPAVVGAVRRAAQEAKDAAAAAKGSEARSEQHEVNAERHATAAGNAAGTAAVDAVDAVREEIHDDRVAAETAATDARTAAGSAAVDAANGVRDEVKEDRVAAEDAQRRARQAATDAEEVVTGGVPDAGPDTRGKIQLAGDLSGTAESPTVPGLAEKAEREHTHTADQVDGAVSDDDPRLADPRDPNPHTHQIVDTDGLQAALDDKAPKNHRHAASDIDGLDEIIGDVDLEGFVKDDDPRLADPRDPNPHTHELADIPDLPEALDGKANRSHGHAAGDISGLSAVMSQVTQATTSNVADSLLRRGSDSTVSVGYPTQLTHATTKEYVDGMASSGGMTDDERIAIFGDASYTQRPHGSLIWSGPVYDPTPNVFVNLRKGSNGRLVVGQNTNGVANVPLFADSPYLEAVVSGLWLVQAVQAWNSDNGARGCGLGRTSTVGDSNMTVWADIGIGRFCHAMKVVWMSKGTRLYPWTWTGTTGGQMSGASRGINSEYSITFLA